MLFIRPKNDLIKFIDAHQENNIFNNLETATFISQLHYNLDSFEQTLPYGESRKLVEEIIIFYSLLAEKVGKEEIKNDIQDTYFKVIAPKVRSFILSQLESVYTLPDNCLINDISNALLNTLQKDLDYVEIYGRIKTPYSIWMKMRLKNISLEQVTDIIALRVIVNTIDECYRVLQHLHSYYSQVPNNLKDFICTPKHNGYQSLHTVVIGPFYKKIEIQIRTKEMEEAAKFGAAAHWLYKQQLLKKSIIGK